jgi:hypothetical protein
LLSRKVRADFERIHGENGHSLFFDRNIGRNTPKLVTLKLNTLKYTPRCFQMIALAAVLFSVSNFVNAAEVKGIEVPDEINCGDCKLVLNGTAVRSVWGFKVYVAGLYLAEPSGDHEAIMTQDRGGKRVHMTMLREVTSDKFESTIMDNINTNFSASEKQQFAGELKQFLGCFDDSTVLKTGSVVNVDYLPGKGTLVSVDGCVYDVIPGEDFYHAVLRLWIGSPPQESLKHGLLGNAA